MFPRIIFLTALVVGLAPANIAADDAPARQFILVNRRLDAGAYRDRPPAEARETFEEVRRVLPEIPGAQIRVGLGFILSYFRIADDDTLVASLRRVLEMAQATDTPVLIQLDGEQWWPARPDLWNWWDETKPGFKPANRENVEWTDWTSDHALKIAWRNWGQQLRVKPPPNLMSPAYRQACHKKMARLIPGIMQWWRALPPEQKDLLVGVKVGWESAIGLNAWYYPGGNNYLDQPAENDPSYRLEVDELPARGVVQIGYAAVKTAKIRTSGKITEADLAEVIRRHLEDLSRVAARLGVPRDKLFTHCGGWKDDELLYQSAVNEFSCPGWSFYKHAADPRKDNGVQRALKQSNAPFWAATEWLLPGPREVTPWRQALEATLADPRCRYVCIYNWEGIKDSEPVLEAIRQVVAARVETKPRSSPPQADE